MTAAELRARCGGEARGYVRCPAHRDSRPSLAVRESHGKVLLRCWAGCDTKDILRALSLRWKDLFADSGPPRRRWSYSTSEIQEMLVQEVTAVRARYAEGLGYAPDDLAVTTWQRNKARMAINSRCDCRLVMEHSRWWEVAPHADDPDWAGMIDQAVVVHGAMLGRNRAQSWGYFDALPNGAMLRDAAISYARKLQRQEALCLSRPSGRTTFPPSPKPSTKTSADTLPDCLR